MSVPEGWVLMPVKPTQEMLHEACGRAISTDVLLDDTRYACEIACYQAFIDKRPQPPKETDQ